MANRSDCVHKIAVLVMDLWFDGSPLIDSGLYSPIQNEGPKGRWLERVQQAVLSLLEKGQGQVSVAHAGYSESLVR